MRIKGKLIKWDSNKAFGFIAPNSGGKHVFIHKTAFCYKKRTPKINDIITFTMSKGKDGRDCASEATFTGEKLKAKVSNRTNMFSVYLLGFFLAFLSFAYFTGEVSEHVLWFYCGLSIATFIIYAWDKFQAQRGGWRTSEGTLHMLSLAGGWPGAAIAQQLLRHKSSKKQFRIGFWLTVGVNLAALGWLIGTGSSLLMR
jgi:uncharacterized membrane protein YsdA (DUF1294 family)/cold shock CspA family protein